LRKVGLGIGLIATVLLPIAFLLFRILRPFQTIATILLLSGLWAFVFGLSMERRERLYYAGFGLIVALLSTFYFIAFRYTAGLVVVAIVALAFVSAVSRPKF
jgi:hypothetical protein